MTRIAQLLDLKLQQGAFVRVSVAVALGCAAIWHVLPHAVWACYLVPQLAALPNAARLEVPFVTEFPSVPASWSELHHHGLSLSVPIAPPLSGPCALRDEACHRELLGGSISIQSEAPADDFWQMVNLRAPDRSDISLLRSARANWETIDALRLRVTTSRAALDSWRYTAPLTHGVVAQSVRNGVLRHVIAVYANDSAEARIVGLAGLSPDAVHRVLGSVRFAGDEAKR